MPLTRNFNDLVKSRVEADPAFRQALFQEAVQTMLDGESRPPNPCCATTSTPRSVSSASRSRPNFRQEPHANVRPPGQPDGGKSARRDQCAAKTDRRASRSGRGRERRLARPGGKPPCRRRQPTIPTLARPPSVHDRHGRSARRSPGAGRENRAFTGNDAMARSGMDEAHLAERYAISRSSRERRTGAGRGCKDARPASADSPAPTGERLRMSVDLFKISKLGPPTSPFALLSKRLSLPEQALRQRSQKGQF